MPRPTNTEKIDLLLKAVAQLEVKLAERTDRFDSTQRKIDERLDRLSQQHESILQRIAGLEERCKSLEKHTDRTWQVWLAIIGAGVAILIAILKK